MATSVTGPTSSGTCTACIGVTTYNSYGKLVNQGQVWMDDPFGYGGGYTDATTGLVYFVNRYYDPSTGQFVTVDPDVATTGQPYEYAADDPINNDDPDGLCSGWGCLGDIGLGIEGAVDSFGSAALGISTIVVSAGLIPETGGLSLIGVGLGFGILGGSAALGYDSYSDFSDAFAGKSSKSSHSSTKQSSHASSSQTFPYGMDDIPYAGSGNIGGSYWC